MNTSASENINNAEEVGGDNKSSNRLLIAIVIGAVVLVVIAIGVTLLQPEPDYLPEDTPEGVAHNYLFALEKGEYQRAYSYLSPNLPGYPLSLEIFTESIEDNSYRFRLDRDTTLRVDSVDSDGDKASVTIIENIFYSGGILGSNEYSDSFKMKLQLEDGEWKISESDGYFAICWDREEGCH
jgi:hypothetical protein